MACRTSFATVSTGAFMTFSPARNPANPWAAFHWKIFLSMTGMRFWRSFAKPNPACPPTGRPQAQNSRALTESQRKNVADDILFLLFCQELAKDRHAVAGFVNPLEDGRVVGVLSTRQRSSLRALEWRANPGFRAISAVTDPALYFKKLL